MLGLGVSEAWINFLNAIDIILLVYLFYFTIFFLAGMRTSRSAPPRPPSNRFAIVIPAHNEESVIGNLVRNLREVDYPSDLYDVYVIADGCTDNTALVAERHGAVCLRREVEAPAGKGAALRDAFQRIGLLDVDSGYDAVIIIDADNLVDLNILKVMNNRLLRGERVIQCYVDSKNPTDNWVTAVFSMTFWVNNRFNLQARSDHGFSCASMGTGTCIDTRLLREVGWRTHTLTEDLEFTLQALLKGTRTTFAHKTRVYDEKPLAFSVTVGQRLRWARGQFQCGFRYIPELLVKGFRERNITLIESGIRLCQLFLIVISVARLVLQGLLSIPAGMLLVHQTLARLGPVQLLLPWIPVSLPLFVLLIDGPPIDAYRYLPLFPIFVFTWSLIVVMGLMTFQRRSWKPTTHSRQVGFREVADRGGSFTNLWS